MRVKVNYESIISDELKEFLRSIGEEDKTLANTQYMHFTTLSWLNGFITECMNIESSILFEISPERQGFDFTISIKKKV